MPAKTRGGDPVHGGKSNLETQARTTLEYVHCSVQVALGDSLRNTNSTRWRPIFILPNGPMREPYGSRRALGKILLTLGSLPRGESSCVRVLGLGPMKQANSEVLAHLATQRKLSLLLIKTPTGREARLKR